MLLGFWLIKVSLPNKCLESRKYGCNMGHGYDIALAQGYAKFQNYRICYDYNNAEYKLNAKLALNNPRCFYQERELMF